MTARFFFRSASLVPLLLTGFLTILATHLILARALPRPMVQAEDKLQPLSASAFSVPGRWTNELGKEVRLTQFLGKRTVFALFYSSCRTICPMTVATLKKVEKSMGEDAKNIQFILVSIDPSHDSPEQLRNFVKTHNLDTTRWHVIASHVDRVRRLAGTLDLGFGHQSADPDLHYMHSLRFAIVNELGFKQDTISTMEPDFERAQKALKKSPGT